MLLVQKGGDVALRQIGQKAVSMPDGLAPFRDSFLWLPSLSVFDRHLLNEPVWNISIQYSHLQQCKSPFSFDQISIRLAVFQMELVQAVQANLNINNILCSVRYSGQAIGVRSMGDSTVDSKLSFMFMYLYEYVRTHLFIYTCLYKSSKEWVISKSKSISISIYVVQLRPAPSL